MQRDRSEEGKESVLLLDYVFLLGRDSSIIISGPIALLRTKRSKHVMASVGVVVSVR